LLAPLLLGSVTDSGAGILAKLWNLPAVGAAYDAARDKGRKPNKNGYG